MTFSLKTLETGSVKVTFPTSYHYSSNSYGSVLGTYTLIKYYHKNQVCFLFPPWGKSFIITLTEFAVTSNNSITLLQTHTYIPTGTAINPQKHVHIHASTHTCIQSRKTTHIHTCTHIHTVTHYTGMQYQPWKIFHYICYLHN